MSDAALEAARRAQVVRDYVVQDTHPIRVRAGQLVRVGREDDEYRGWWWCTGPDDRSSWVPGELLRRSGAEGHMLEDYDATELAVRRGEEILENSACDRAVRNRT